MAKNVTLRLDSKVHADARAAADRLNMPLSTFVSLLIRDYVGTVEFGPPEKKAEAVEAVA